VQVWRWEAPLHFANADRFSERVSLLIQELSAPPVVAPLDAVLVSITPSTSAAASEGAGGGGVWQQQREKGGINGEPIKIKLYSLEKADS
jgi:hypothetical protein